LKYRHTASAASSALRNASPIPSPPIGSMAAAALPRGMTPRGQSGRMENRGSGEISQGDTRLAELSIAGSD